MATTRQPKEMYMLALTEMCQRFGFWGIGNLLVLYLVQVQKFTDKDADHLFGIFTGLAFILPVFGGYIADRFCYRRPVIWGLYSTAIGCFLIATGSLSLIYVALIFAAVGAAVFTPSIYTVLGSLYRKHHHMREGGFSIYYSAVNIGVFLAMIILGAFGQAGHWGLAFFLAGLIQIVGLITFAKAMKTIGSTNLATSKTAPKNFKEAPLHAHEKRRITVIIVLCLFSILFWMAYNQAGSSMTLFALRYTDRNLLGYTMPPSWLLSVESLYLVILALPLAALYAFLAKKRKDPTPPMKTALSLFAMTICFAIMAVGAKGLLSSSTGSAVSPFYLLGAYFFMAVGEMLLAPIGLSLITHLSPHRFTALLVGVWYLCVGIAYYLGGLLAGLMPSLSTLTGFFNIFVITSLIPAFLLLFFVRRLNKMRHLESL